MRKHLAIANASLVALPCVQSSCIQILQVRRDPLCWSRLPDVSDCATIDCTMVAGHRRSAKVKKGDTILTFLQAALKQLLPDFRELRCVLPAGPSTFLPLACLAATLCLQVALPH